MIISYVDIQTTRSHILFVLPPQCIGDRCNHLVYFFLDEQDGGEDEILKWYPMSTGATLVEHYKYVYASETLS